MTKTNTEQCAPSGDKLLAGAGVGMAFGAIQGSPGGPIGTGVGAILGGLGGLVAGMTFDKYDIDKCLKTIPEEKEEDVILEEEMYQEALILPPKPSEEMIVGSPPKAVIFTPPPRRNPLMHDIPPQPIIGNSTLYDYDRHTGDGLSGYETNGGRSENYHSSGHDYDRASVTKSVEFCSLAEDGSVNWCTDGYRP